MILGLVFRVKGLGFMILGLGFGIKGLGFRVWVLGFEFQGSGSQELALRGFEARNALTGKCEKHYGELPACIVDRRSGWIGTRTLSRFSYA